MKAILKSFTIFIALIFAAPSLSSAQTTVDINPVKDNTLYETDSGELSNGSGDFLFFGQTGASANNKLRRGLLFFDIDASLPAGATVTDASLSVTVSRVSMDDALSISLHRITQDWGEGASDAPGQEGAGAQSETDDATWLHSFFDATLWATPGGDYNTDASSTIDMGGVGTYTFTGLGDDVQNMLGKAEADFGWIVLGDETVANGAKRIDGRTSSGTVPVLTVTYEGVDTSVETEIPNLIAFSEVYPNPFSSKMRFTMGLKSASPVSVQVYDYMGRQVADLLDRDMLAGEKVVLNFEANDLPAGNYFVVAKASSHTKMQKVTLIK